MGRPRIRPVRNLLTAIAVAGAMTFTIAAPAAAKSWQHAWGDYDSQQQWHDAGWWLQNRNDWVIVHHPEWTEGYADTWGQIGDTDQLHVWHYGTGGFDRATKLTIHKLVEVSPATTTQGASSETDTSVMDVHKS
jgi:hypothetical protein